MISFGRHPLSGLIRRFVGVRSHLAHCSGPELLHHRRHGAVHQRYSVGITLNDQFLATRSRGRGVQCPGVLGEFSVGGAGHVQHWHLQPAGGLGGVDTLEDLRGGEADHGSHRRFRCGCGHHHRVRSHRGSDQDDALATPGPQLGHRAGHIFRQVDAEVESQHPIPLAGKGISVRLPLAQIRTALMGQNDADRPSADHHSVQSRTVTAAKTHLRGAHLVGSQAGSGRLRPVAARHWCEPGPGRTRQHTLRRGPRSGERSAAVGADLDGGFASLLSPSKRRIRRCLQPPRTASAWRRGPRDRVAEDLYDGERVRFDGSRAWPSDQGFATLTCRAGDPVESHRARRRGFRKTIRYLWP
jgi:hypothetical protein